MTDYIPPPAINPVAVGVFVSTTGLDVLPDGNVHNAPAYDHDIPVAYSEPAHGPITDYMEANGVDAQILLKRNGFYSAYAMVVTSGGVGVLYTTLADAVAASGSGYNMEAHASTVQTQTNHLTVGPTPVMFYADAAETNDFEPLQFKATGATVHVASIVMVVTYYGPMPDGFVTDGGLP